MTKKDLSNFGKSGKMLSVNLHCSCVYEMMKGSLLDNFNCSAAKIF